MSGSANSHQSLTLSDAILYSMVTTLSPLRADQHLISPYTLNRESNRKITMVKEIITD